MKRVKLEQALGDDVHGIEWLVTSGAESQADAVEMAQVFRDELRDVERECIAVCRPARGRVKKASAAP